MTLAEIIERLEKATGPDQEIDRAIMAAFYARERRYIGCRCDPSCCPNSAHLDSVWVDPSTDKWVTTAIDGFEFTSSVDRVMSLAKNHGFYIRIEPRFHIDGERIYYLAYAIRPRWADYTPADDWFDTGEARHAEPAIAACLALCRALQAQGSSHD